MRLDGERVREGRERLARSIQDMSAKARVSPHTWIRAERGEEIRPASARNIAAALGVEPSELLEEPTLAGKAEAPPPPAEDRPGVRRSPLETVVNASNFLARAAADPHLGIEQVYGLAVAAEALEGQLSILLGDPEASGVELSGQDLGAISRAMNRLEEVSEEYNSRFQMQLQFDEIEREEGAVSPKEYVEQLESPNDA